MSELDDDAQDEVIGTTVLTIVRHFEDRGFKAVPMDPLWEALADQNVTMAAFARVVRTMVAANWIVLDNDCFRLTKEGRRHAEESDGRRRLDSEYRQKANDDRSADPPVGRARARGNQDGHQSPADGPRDPRPAILSGGHGSRLTVRAAAVEALADARMRGQHEFVSVGELLHSLIELWSSVKCEACGEPCSMRFATCPSRAAAQRAERSLQFLHVMELIAGGYPGRFAHVTDSGQQAATWMANLRLFRT